MCSCRAGSKNDRNDLIEVAVDGNVSSAVDFGGKNRIACERASERSRWQRDSQPLTNSNQSPQRSPTVQCSCGGQHAVGGFCRE